MEKVVVICPRCGQFVSAHTHEIEHDGDTVGIKWLCKCLNCHQKFACSEWFEKRGEEIELEEE